mmetsp:Transcript_50294/g.92960  ORF Transcript_50294/g.92960 Transcript_50294/m.92960 type:complete len:224 (+) Transcript_50294:77-748(+)
MRILFDAAGLTFIWLLVALSSGHVQARKGLSDRRTGTKDLTQEEGAEAGRRSEVSHAKKKIRRKRREKRKVKKAAAKAPLHREDDAFASEDTMERELNMINQRVEKLRARIEKAKFATEEREALLETVEQYKEDELDRIEESIEVGKALYGKGDEVDRHGRYDREDKWGKRHRLSPEKEKEKRESNMARRKELLEQRKKLQERQQELERRITDGEKLGRRSEL